MRAVLLACTLALALSPAASAYRTARIVPQPKLYYYVALPDWKKPLARVVKELNRQRVGVRLEPAKIPQQASIQVGRFDTRCGLAGVDATTQTLQGGFAVMYLPRRCKGAMASIIAAHELGHALGLRHENRRCALMNSTGSGPQGIPTRCLGMRFDWLRHPFRSDDIAGLRRLFRNTPPRMTLRADGVITVPAGTPLRFDLTVRDREHNLSELTVDYGDGSREERTLDDPPPSSHTYSQPGTYTITATALDFYLERDTATLVVTVT